MQQVGLFMRLAVAVDDRIGDVGHQAAAAGKARKPGQMCRDQPFHRVFRHSPWLGLMAPFHAATDLRQEVGGNHEIEIGHDAQEAERFGLAAGGKFIIAGEIALDQPDIAIEFGRQP